MRQARRQTLAERERLTTKIAEVSQSSHRRAFQFCAGGDGLAHSGIHRAVKIFFRATLKRGASFSFWEGWLRGVPPPPGSLESSR